MKLIIFSPTKVTLSILLTSLSLSLVVPSRALSQTVTLQETISTALEKNSNIRSKDKILEGMQLRIQGEKKSKLPTVSIGYSVSKDWGSSTSSLDAMKSRYSSTTRGGQISINWNIYDGGAKKYNIAAMECDLKERQATYNSTNTLIQNTQGQIAGLVVESYTSISNSRANIDFSLKVLEILKSVKTVAKTESEKAEVDNFIEQVNLQLKEQQSQALLSANDFLFVVTEPAPQKLESLQEMIQHTQIPRLRASAKTIALSKSPEIKSAKYQIKCAELRRESTRASIHSPQVDLSVNRGFGNRTTDHFNHVNSASNGTSASISVRYTFGPGRSKELDAQAKEKQSAEENLISEISNINKQLDQNYDEMEIGLQFTETYKANLATGEERISRYLRAINQNQPVNVSDMNKEIGTLIGNWYGLQRYLISVANNKFQIQKSIGILFESLGVNTLSTGQLLVR